MIVLSSPASLKSEQQIHDTDNRLAGVLTSQGGGISNFGPIVRHGASDLALQGTQYIPEARIGQPKNYCHETFSQLPWANPRDKLDANASHGLAARRAPIDRAFYNEEKAARLIMRHGYFPQQFNQCLSSGQNLLAGVAATETYTWAPQSQRDCVCGEMEQIGAEIAKYWKKQQNVEASQRLVKHNRTDWHRTETRPTIDPARLLWPRGEWLNKLPFMPNALHEPSNLRHVTRADKGPARTHMAL